MSAVRGSEEEAGDDVIVLDEEEVESGSDGRDFGDRLLELVRNGESKGVEEKVLVREAAGFAAAPGDFRNLELGRRVRAVLLTLKMGGLVFWDGGSRRWMREAVRKTPETFYRMEREVMGQEGLFVSLPELYERLEMKD
jgi:hypothetical protein